MFSDFTDWFLNLVKEVWLDLWDFVRDSFLYVLNLVLEALADLLGAIPVPDWMQHGLNSIYQTLDPGIIYVLVQVGFPLGLSFIGVAYLFKLTRKFVTLFQW